MMAESDMTRLISGGLLQDGATTHDYEACEFEKASQD